MKIHPLVSNGYKALAAGLLLYALAFGLTITMPYNAIWGQSARVIFYHVPMWFAELVMMGISVFYSVKLLRAMDPDLQTSQSPLSLDIQAREAARIGVLFNALGLLTGIIWSRVTWNQSIPSSSFSAWWSWDPIQTCALIAMLIYLAYFLLRASIPDVEQRAKIGAVYNLFAFVMLIPLFFIIPRSLDGLHPTAQNEEQLNIFASGNVTGMVRLVLYPGMLGFVLLGIWLLEVRTKAERLHLRLNNWLADKHFDTESST